MNGHRQETELYSFVVCVVFLEGIDGNRVGICETVYVYINKYMYTNTSTCKYNYTEYMHLCMYYIRYSKICSI